MKKTVVHHIVYSTKGGCGKTAFSLCLSYTDLSKFIEKISENEGTTYSAYAQPTASLLSYNFYLDLDFLGTSLIECLFLSDEEKKGCITMQDLIFNRRTVNELKKIISCVNKGGQSSRENSSDCVTVNNVMLYVIPSAFDQKEKNNFQVKRKHTPLLRYDEFRHEINYIISHIKIFADNDNIKKSDYTLNYIYDLPPNSDGYTEAFFEEIFKNGDKKILYVLFNNDAMLKSNLEWFKSFLSEDKTRDCLVVFVYTENLKTDRQYDCGTISSMMREQYNFNKLPAYFYTFKYNDNVNKLYNDEYKASIQLSFDPPKLDLSLQMNIEKIEW